MATCRLRTVGALCGDQLDEYPLASLRTFALKALAADEYPRARHRCRVPSCPACGAGPLEVTVEAHTGATEPNFRGVVFARCPRCGSETSIFRFTGPHRKAESRERLSCHCGHDQFWLTICERTEGDEGLPGFFDEGVVAGCCAECGGRQIVVAFD